MCRGNLLSLASLESSVTVFLGLLAQADSSLVGFLFSVDVPKQHAAKHIKQVCFFAVGNTQQPINLYSLCLVQAHLRPRKFCDGFNIVVCPLIAMIDMICSARWKLE